MEKYQGEDISFNVKFQKGENESINSFADLSEITIYAYTDGCDIVRFSYPSKANYESLTLVNNTTLAGVISASKTKIMAPGFLRVEVRARKNNENMVEKRITGIVIVKDLIKTEI
ncbi:MAG: hypothetical protein LBP72_01130 [Dysgonamonadaceae bacterium]|jgi:hypothetical protein|nr:hypothetical protein [Dysgonamonadaceae bacterium]